MFAFATFLPTFLPKLSRNSRPSAIGKSNERKMKGAHRNLSVGLAEYVRNGKNAVKNSQRYYLREKESFPPAWLNSGYSF